MISTKCGWSVIATGWGARRVTPRFVAAVDVDGNRVGAVPGYSVGYDRRVRIDVAKPANPRRTQPRIGFVVVVVVVVVVRVQVRSRRPGRVIVQNKNRVTPAIRIWTSVLITQRRSHTTPSTQRVPQPSRHRFPQHRSSFPPQVLLRSSRASETSGFGNPTAVGTSATADFVSPPHELFPLRPRQL
jgi:hypothetical protein